MRVKADHIDPVCTYLTEGKVYTGKIVMITNDNPWECLVNITDDDGDSICIVVGGGKICAHIEAEWTYIDE